MLLVSIFAPRTFQLLLLLVQILLLLVQIGLCWLAVVVYDKSATSGHNVASTEAAPETSAGRRLLAQVMDVKKSYGRVQALRGDSFDIEEGACIGLLGPNGAGESTCCTGVTGTQA